MSAATGQRGSAWDRIFADPKLSSARRKLSADEIMTIIRHVWAAEQETPGEPYRINLNGKEWPWGRPAITHEEICELADQPAYASVTWSFGAKGRGSISGMTFPGGSVSVFDGMNIDCVVTGNA